MGSEMCIRDRSTHAQGTCTQLRGWRCRVWRAWQLARGSWDVCEARAEDVLDADEALWSRLREGGRLMDPSSLDDADD